MSLQSLTFDTSARLPRTNQKDWIVDGGEMGKRVESKDWSATPLGAIESWPQSLRTTVSICLNSRFPTVLFWGPDFVTVYNDAYIAILGTKHPWALGRPACDVWPEIWNIVEPMMRGVVATGAPTWSEDQLLNMNRKGYVEECYLTYSFAPVTIESGETGGILACVAETTERVLGERRMRTLRELGAAVSGARTVEKVCDAATEVFSRNVADVAFALLYMLDEDGKAALLTSTSGIEPGHPASPPVIRLDDDRADWPLARVARTGHQEIVPDLAQLFGQLPGGAWPESARTAIVLPIDHAGQGQPHGLLISGTSPRRGLEENYGTFFKLAAGQIATAVANARAYDDECKRAEALAEIDRAKTAFFSNVSHEFRTPLTLMLGPLEEELAEQVNPLPQARHERLATVHRNSLRLLKLVNTLLDFSRIEAGRSRVSFEPTDLAAYTAELAGVFGSVFEKANLTLTIDCPPLPQPIYVDREMWEKVVLNLVSNAFKHTFKGSVTISLRWHVEHAELRVSDTGVGIPEAELPHLFERFHRVKGAKSRSHEGTGIGLALVQELVSLHGGTVHAESQEGKGSTFIVTVKAGSAHVPPSSLSAEPQSAPSVARPDACVAEALHWLHNAAAPGDPSPLSTEANVLSTPSKTALLPGGGRPRILLADDNVDMRNYVQRLLADRYDVLAVPDGLTALAAAQQMHPDLVLTDIMMPGLDGFGLLRELKANPQTRTIPVILLSARAGEESAVEGLAAGADDYLTKPFSAQELMTRVTTHLELARIRREWENELQQANKELEAFSYSVSHDLRAPLRTIDGFSKVLLDKYGEKLDQQACHYLQRVRIGTQKMSVLIDSLLQLARMSRAVVRKESISLSALARGVVSELRSGDPSRKVSFEIAEGISAYGDAQLITVVLENLLGNAWKYTSKRTEAKIEFGRASGTVFYIRDNGAGFDMTYASQLFAPFRRLHSDSEFEGTGIGLATVQRIISRHGGRIWVEAVVDQGATFYFTLGEMGR